MKQGDVYWYEFRAPDKRRPVLIVTRNSSISYLTNVTVAQITTTIRRVPSELELTPADDGTFERCVVNAYNLQTIPKAQLRDVITELSPERVRGTPARLEDLTRGLPQEVLTWRDGDKWSIQEQAGHLLDLEGLGMSRLDDFEAGREALSPRT